MTGVIILKNQMMLAKVHFNKVEILNSLNDVFLSTTVMVSDVNDFLQKEQDKSIFIKPKRGQSKLWNMCLISIIFLNNKYVNIKHLEL